MTKYDDSPFHRINSFVENRLRGIADLGAVPDLDEAVIPQLEDYISDLDTDEEFAVPFLSPGGQQAEQTTLWNNQSFKNIPIGTYSVVMDRTSEPWDKTGKVSYTFYSGDSDKLFEIAEFINDLCGREDWSAYDINYFFRKDETYPFDFKTLCINSIGGPITSKEEGGRYSMMVIVGYSATYEGPNRVDDWSENDTSLGMR